jgi:hypothetical protein
MTATPAVARSDPGFWQQDLIDAMPPPPPKPKGKPGRPFGAKTKHVPDPVKLPRTLPMAVDYPTAQALAGGVSYGFLRKLVLNGKLASVKVEARRLIVVDGPKGLRELLTPKGGRTASE